MFRIDATVSKDYYIIYKDDVYFCKVSKTNDIEFVKKYFNIK